jgi:hypothetical protein
MESLSDASDGVYSPRCEQALSNIIKPDRQVLSAIMQNFGKVCLRGVLLCFRVFQPLRFLIEATDHRAGLLSRRPQRVVDQVHVPLRRCRLGVPEQCPDDR